MMPAAVRLRPDWDAKRVRAAAREAKDADQVRRLLALAAAYEGEDRTTAAKIGAMDPQRLRDWVRRFNTVGPEGLIDRKPAGAARRLTPEQEAELTALIEAGPDFERDGVVRWRCVDLRQLILTRWNIAYHERTIGKLLRRLGFRHIPARPRHLGQDPARIEEFKKFRKTAERMSEIRRSPRLRVEASLQLDGPLLRHQHTLPRQRHTFRFCPIPDLSAQ
jgi:transposase